MPPALSDPLPPSPGRPRWAMALLLVGLGAAALGWLGLGSARAFGDKEVTLINLGLPMIRAAIRARRHRRRMAPAVLQAGLGGYMMRKAMEKAELAEGRTAWEAWRAKLMMNMGASLAESAGGDLEFRMDLGPVWMVTQDGKIHWKLGLHGSLAPLLNRADGARVNWPQSFRYGTLAFHRERNADGTIGSRGALAYSNANNFITNDRGHHAGHELIHTFQYRRDAFLSPRLTRLWPGLADRLDDVWLDDTGWAINWSAQCLWARSTGADRDFDILMEKEAYYLADHIQF
ncbi:MAG: hypothetical protein OZSIB_3566 [Candidatus Ozemobacter sibiricus]|jgi:hypothetical protein|uniref:Uncharacterized protein n=1 Tax=Candidatus Ozemobacter sibiricus TaxID=2268124 RepID=A0A367ZRQ1_9BACT|nr:MAG: hypothetical protein OZSIB_3566 [Candidatus Ozemobacter sibiricus]